MLNDLLSLDWIMRRKSFFAVLIFLYFAFPLNNKVTAWNYGIVTATSIPTRTPTLTPTPLTVHTSTCDGLTIVSGNNSTVPANVTLRVRGSDNRGTIQGYRYFYGDGKFDETSNTEMTHRYDVSGTFLARAEIKDSQGIWKGSSLCEVTVTVQSTTIESHKSDCSELFITDGNNTQFPTTVRYTVTGFDNKGTVKRYKVDFGDGTSEEKADNRFEKRYDRAGTYVIRGYTLDTRDSWKGGSGRCEKLLYVNTTPLTKQPTTGTPTAFTLFALTGGLWSSLMFAVKRHLIVS